MQSPLSAGDFTASTMGSGVGDVVIEPNGDAGPDLEGVGRLGWSAKQTVNGNTGNRANVTMSGYLNMSLVLGSHTVTFTSTCILEAGVFAGESEDDPFGNGDFHTAIRGVEGEWVGIARNLTGSGSSTRVVASLAAWTTDAGPRFKLDMVGGDFSNPATCPIEDNTGTTPSAAIAGPTLPNGNTIVVNAPNMEAGVGTCID